MKIKLAVFMSHPIQYQVPLLRKIAAREEIDLTAYFFWDFGVKETKDPEFKQNVKWDIPILEGYKYKFIKNYSKNPSSNFFGQLNFGVIPELFKNKYDAVLLYGWNSFPNWLAFIFAPLVGTKIILTGESPLSQELKKSKLILAVKSVVLKIVFWLSSAIMYIGKENKKFYEFYNVPENKLFFMPYAVENERFIEEKNKLFGKRDEFRKKLNILTDTTVILFTGKLFQKKRPMDLLRAYSEIKDEKKTLVFVGDGEQRNDLEKFVEEDKLENVHFVGFKNQTELAEFYILSDVFILPSGAGETWGLVVNEAMCFGLPVIVSDVVGCGADLIRQGENGYIFPCGDVGSLKNSLEAIIRDKKSRENFGKKSLEIISGYSQDVDVRSIVEVLNKII